MKKTVVWILVLALIAAVTVIGTIAYLKDVASEENVFTLGNVDIELLEYEREDTETKDGEAEVQAFKDDKPLLPAVVDKDFDYVPGDTFVDWDSDVNQIKPGTDYTSPIWDPAKINNEVDKMVFVKNTGNYSTYVRTYFAFEAGNFDTFDKFEKNIHINLNDNEDEWVWEWVPFLAEIDGEKYFIAKATYQKVLEPEKLTEISLSQIALDSRADNEDADAFGEEYRVLVSTQGIQAAGFEKSETALDEGFGTDIPFEGVTFEAGIDLKTALHNLNGDTTKSITAKVESVTFGLNEDHSEIVYNYPATLTSAEQDVPVYTYYVPNDDASKYDIYVLADDKIYTPKNSTELFYYMTALTTVYTDNLDVSRTEIMGSMFFGCTALTTLDVVNWDIRNVTDTNCMFVYCHQLNDLDVSNWNVSNVTNMNSMFYDCNELTYLDVSDWDVSNATTMRTVFYKCVKLNNLDVSNWNVSKVTDMTAMFFGCLALTSLDVDEWDVGNVTTFERFLSRIDNSKNMSISEIDLSGWNTDSLVNMAYMFQGCDKLTSLDMSNWNVSGVKSLNGVFEICEGLTTLDVSGWDVSNVTTMGYLFRRCGMLTELDLSGWETDSLVEATNMFESDKSLATIYVGDGWNVTGVTPSTAMFGGCSNLKGENNTTYDSAYIAVEYARIDTPEAPGYLTYKAAESTNP